MSQWTSLETPTGRIQAWRAEPAIPPRGALLVVQEIFGVNRHIRQVCDTFAAHGYVAVAPAFFDHLEPGVELDYDAEGVKRGKTLADRLGFDRVLQDIEAAANMVQEVGQVGVVGYCWGGSVAFLANTRLSLPAVSYYGARTAPFLDEQLDAPMMFHFGDHDASIPTGVIDLHRSKQPSAEIHVYRAGHGFNCDQRADYDEASATLALERTLSFFRRTLRPAY